MAGTKADGPGVYRPLTYRARHLVNLLKKARHRTVQNAIIQELIHELQRGSRRARKSGGSFLDWLDGLGAGIENASRGFAKWWNRKNGWGTPQKRHCVDHPRLQFRNDLEYKAHLLEDKERAQSRSKGKDGTPQPSQHERAQQKARRVLTVAGHRPPESPKRQQGRPAPVNGHQPKAPVRRPLFTERELKEFTARRVLDRDLRQARDARKRGDEAAAVQYEKRAERKRAEMRAGGFKDTPLTEAQHKNLSARRLAQNTAPRVNGAPPRQANGRYAPAAKPAPNGKPAPARAPVNGKAPAPAAKPAAMTVPANKHGVTRAKDLKAMQPGSLPKPKRKLTLRRAKPAQAPKAPPKAPALKPAPKVTVPSRPPVPPLPSQTVRAPAPRRKLTPTRSR